MDGSHNARVHHVECGGEQDWWEEQEYALEEEGGERGGMVGRDRSTGITDGFTYNL